MGHCLVLVFIRDIESSIHEQVWELLTPHTGDSAAPELTFAYWKIGGAWNGLFRDMLELSRVETDHFGNPIAGNVCRVRDIADDFDPVVVVTPDGVLHSVSWGEPIARGEWLAMRERWRDCYAVAVDGKA